MSQRDRRGRSFFGSRHERKMGRTPGHELDLLARREAPVVCERTIVDIRPAARTNPGPVAQLVAGYWLCVRQPVAVPAPGPNLRGEGARRLRKTEPPFQQVVSQVGPNGCD